MDWGRWTGAGGPERGRWSGAGGPPHWPTLPMPHPHNTTQHPHSYAPIPPHPHPHAHIAGRNPYNSRYPVGRRLASCSRACLQSEDTPKPAAPSRLIFDSSSSDEDEPDRKPVGASGAAGIDDKGRERTASRLRMEHRVTCIRLKHGCWRGRRYSGLVQPRMQAAGAAARARGLVPHPLPLRRHPGLLCSVSAGRGAAYGPRVRH